MDRLERDVALANHNDDSIPAYVNPEEHHAFAAEDGAPDSMTRERDDSSSVEPGDPDATELTDDMQVVDPLEEERDLAEAVVDIVFSPVSEEVELDEEDSESEGERLDRESKRGNHAGGRSHDEPA